MIALAGGTGGGFWDWEAGCLGKPMSSLQFCMMCPKNLHINLFWLGFGIQPGPQPRNLDAASNLLISITCVPEREMASIL